eukprot:3453580-Rhodomonas_salina.1
MAAPSLYAMGDQGLVDLTFSGDAAAESVRESTASLKDAVLKLRTSIPRLGSPSSPASPMEIAQNAAFASLSHAVHFSQESLLLPVPDPLVGGPKDAPHIRAPGLFHQRLFPLRARQRVEDSLQFSNLCDELLGSCGARCAKGLVR